MERSFDYKLTSVQMYTVLTLKGAICKDSLDKLEQCRGEVASLDQKLFIIYFRDVTCVDVAAYRHLTILQQEIRKKSNLLVVGLSSELRGLLTMKAIVRQNELKRNLEEALKVA